MPTSCLQGLLQKWLGIVNSTMNPHSLKSVDFKLQKPYFQSDMKRIFSFTGEKFRKTVTFPTTMNGKKTKIHVGVNHQQELECIGVAATLRSANPLSYKRSVQQPSTIQQPDIFLNSYKVCF
jgi:hypothetical protein